MSTSICGSDYEPLVKRTWQGTVETCVTVKKDQSSSSGFNAMAFKPGNERQRKVLYEDEEVKVEKSNKGGCPISAELV